MVGKWCCLPSCEVMGCCGKGAQIHGRKNPASRMKVDKNGIVHGICYAPGYILRRDPRRVIGFSFPDVLPEPFGDQLFNVIGRIGDKSAGHAEVLEYDFDDRPGALWVMPNDDPKFLTIVVKERGATKRRIDGKQ